MKRFLRLNSFLLGLGACVFLAWLRPALGGTESPLPIARLKLLGVFVIFFNQGVLIPTDELKSGLSNWPLHLCVTLNTYLFIPLLILAGFLITANLGIPLELREGFLFLSILPGTIAASVAFTSLARGHVAGALFNSTLSSLLGVWIVPIASLAYIEHRAGTGQEIDVLPLYLNIGRTILLPLAAGQLARPVLGGLFGTYRNGIRRLNTGIILFMVWSAFADSFLRGVWGGLHPGLFVGILTACGAVQLISGLWIWTLTRWIGLSPACRITAVFCGCHKSLAMGIPLSAMIFDGLPSAPDLGLFLLPLLVYHPLQLILSGWLAPRLQAFVEAQAER